MKANSLVDDVELVLLVVLVDVLEAKLELIAHSYYGGCESKNVISLVSVVLVV